MNQSWQSRSNTPAAGLRKSPVKSSKSLATAKSGQFLPLHDRKCHNMKGCRGSSAEDLFFFTFDSKTFWGFTEVGCLPVWSLLSWLIRKIRLRLGFWTSDVFDPLCSANKCFAGFLQSKESAWHILHLQTPSSKGPHSTVKITSFSFFPHKHKLVPILQVCSRLDSLPAK